MAQACEAAAHWRRLDCEGTDRCRLIRAEHGWLLHGQAIWRDAAGDSDLVYLVRCTPGWESLSADVTGTFAGRPLGLRIERTAQGWSLNGRAQPEAQAHADIDLGFTPATNLLPLRRLDLVPGDNRPAGAAWLVPGMDRLETLPQLYARIDDRTVAYAAPSVDYAADLTVHPSGFVTTYPGLWDGWVDD